ncbi:MAG: YceI-like domain protein [Pedosphaera sp.]|nr:YceI-like domain protein [Pedosphaera sp.]
MMRSIKVILLMAGFAAMAITTRAAPLAIDPRQSTVEVAVSCSMDSFVGHLEKYQAAIECDPTAALPTKADLSFDFADLKTGKKDRDSAMLKWLEYSAHPAASFHLTGWNQVGTTNIGLGTLTMHGVVLPVQMPVVINHDDTVWYISGQTLIDYRDFKLPKIRKALVLTVNPKLTVKFHLVGKIVASK